MLLEPVGEGGIGHAMLGGETLSAQTAAFEGGDESGLLFPVETHPAEPVDFDQTAVAIHRCQTSNTYGSSFKPPHTALRDTLTQSSCGTFAKGALRAGKNLISFSSRAELAGFQ
jgi:hypothetical protein